MIDQNDSFMSNSVNKLNVVKTPSGKIKLEVVDVREIMKRRTLIRNSPKASISNKAQNLGETFTVERDYVTPENDSILMELKRKQIEEELSRSVTIRKPLRRIDNDAGRVDSHKVNNFFDYLGSVH